jgi:hypothetical protein
MKKTLRFLKQIWFLNFIKRVYLISKYFIRKYLQIIKRGISSKEDTNFTYNITDSNILYLAHIIPVITKKDYKMILGLLMKQEMIMI